MKKLSKRKNKSKNKKQFTDAEQLNQALERMQRFEAQNASFASDFKAMFARVLPQIEPHEIKKLEAFNQLAVTLIPFFSKKTLPEYLREELHEWIQSLIYSVDIANPFADKIDTSATEALMREHLRQHTQDTDEKVLKKMQ